MKQETVLRVQGITKLFASTRALVDVTLDFKSGEIRGLIGENGSGKSTLSNVISGQLQPDEGTMELHGQPYRPTNNVDAKNHKICMIVQEMGTIDGLSVAANIFLGKEDLFQNRAGLLDTKRMNAEAGRILKEIGVEYIQPTALVNRMPFEDRKIVEMARAMYLEPEILIVDETTTALSQKGRDILYAIINRMKDEDKTVIFISHDLEEVMDKCDTISVMRDGSYVDTLAVKSCTPSQIRQLMVGREISDEYYRSDYSHEYSDKVALECTDINAGILKNISLQLHRGEILGLAGLTDCGIHELGKVLFGLITPATGKVTAYKEDGPIEIKKPITAINAKMGYVSKNRDQEALMLLSSIQDNISLPSLDMLKKGFLIPPKSEKELAQRGAEQMQIKMRGIDQTVMYLSGGNKQKVVLAKWIGNGSEILILDCPTRGIDVGVKAAIYRLMEELKAQGKAILMISEELPEVIGMSDRILVLKDGEVQKEFLRGPDVTESVIIEYMI